MKMFRSEVSSSNMVPQHGISAISYGGNIDEHLPSVMIVIIFTFCSHLLPYPMSTINISLETDLNSFPQNFFIFFSDFLLNN